jgi:hypothetical protein
MRPRTRKHVLHTDNTACNESVTMISARAATCVYSSAQRACDTEMCNADFTGAPQSMHEQRE